MTTLVGTRQRLRPPHAHTDSPIRVPLAPARVSDGVVAPRIALLVLGDVAALMAAVLAAGAPVWALALVPATLTALTTRGHYGPRAAGVLDTFGGVLTSVSIGAGALLLAAA